MGKLFGSIAFFLAAVFLVYLLNLPAAEIYALNYTEFAAPHVIASFELLHHPFEHLWVIPSWLIAGFLGGIVTRSWKGAIAVSLVTGFILSLTWIFFMWRYAPLYWNNFTATRSTSEVLGQTFGIGLLLGFFSAAPAICGAYLTAPRKKGLEQAPIKEIQSVCPNCGAIFQSKPKFCYKCNTILETNNTQEN
ncbi:MAG: zinc ribbon domain-containing protein [Candidatus Helarchaeota archaeon]|nr:zinc ribbon domain-containing protein [Candidatus Helarchaeota archaeon]